ncbi:MAG: flagellin [Hyphomonadaceae bacterium]|jgi:flagellin|uniref:flagellin N-terminal helical domain-containing protein n=1 Tax=Aquidulcibacter sp. TaxID=2052990 RepID=UPI0022CC6A61|nr:flagellin [Aquidulcibacter sp.]MCE2892103.1 flagellin [Hyphomonadaceae bacterium]MCZ8207933.1 flagellin [Aquidulcibacter sp.]
MISVNTNIGAMAAIQNLRGTNSDMQTTQNAISTGKKVATAKDNGAIWTIANKMRSDVKAYDRVRESNERAGAILETAISASEAIMELLNEMKGKALAATQPGLSTPSQGALNADFIQLRDQITNIIANASFDGTNMVGATPASAISLGDAAGANSITVAGANMSLGGAVVTVTGTSDLSSVANATAALTVVNASITNVGTQLATWGAGAKRFEVHRDFVSKLQDALNIGIGAITDADLSKESARLQSLQVKQQLGIQALSIANSSGQAALSLFRN